MNLNTKSFKSGFHNVFTIMRVIIYGNKRPVKIGTRRPVTGAELWIKRIFEKLNNFTSVSLVWLNDEPPYWFKPKRLGFYIKALLNWFKIFKLKPERVIFACSGYGESTLPFLILFIKLFKVKFYPVFFHYEERKTKIRTRFLRCLANLLRKCEKSLIYFCYQKISTKILTISESSKQQLISFFKISSEKIMNVGIAFDRREKRKVDKRDIDFICVGRYGKFLYLPEIWTKIHEKKPNSTFIMIGIGGENSDIQKMKDIGKFQHLGVIDSYVLYPRAKVLLHPSIYEGYGIVIAEALYHGLIIVAYDLKPIHEYFGVDGKIIRVCKVGDVDTFSKMAIEALNDYNDELARKAEILAEKQPTWDDVAKKIMEILVN
jgi:glycosyltransferase involved in cell wall biosynthesis